MEIKLSQKIKILSFVSALGVVLIHSMDYPSYSTSSACYDLFAAIEKWISISFWGHISVGLFFTISGYLFMVNMTDYRCFIQKLKRRIMTLVIPFVAWCLFGYLIFLVLSSIPFTVQCLNTKAGVSFQELKKIFIAMDYSHHLWYIQNLCMFFLVSFVLIPIRRNKAVATTILAVLCGLSLAGIELEPFKTTRFVQFYFGVYLAMFFPNTVEIKSRRLSIVSGIVLVALSVIITVWDTGILDKACYFIMPIAFWHASDLVLNRLSTCKMIQRFQDDSFFLYCSHGTIIECVKQVFSLLGGSAVVMIVSYFLSPLIVVTLLLTALTVLKRTMPKTLGIVTGFRSK